MFTSIPKSENGLLFITDVRLRHDRNLAEKVGGQPVLEHWPFGTQCLGKSNWANTTKVALYDFGEKITPVIKRERTAELLAFLQTYKFKCILVMQTRSSEQKSKDDFGDAQGLVGTHCWAALKAPDRLPDMAGCVWDSPFGPLIGVLNPVNYEYVYRELIRRHIRLGLELTTRDLLLKPQEMSWARNSKSTEILNSLIKRAHGGTPIAVDIESASDQNLITALGFSDGVSAVSIPFESFPIFGTQDVEPAAAPEVLELARVLLLTNAAKVFHNYSYDVPFLASKGFMIGGSIHDTMAMHVCVYKQWPHGLQRACAQELVVPPWKSEHRPQFAKRLGLTKKDVGWWTCEPEELRRYNALDSYYTAKLAHALAPKVGIRL